MADLKQRGVNKKSQCYSHGWFETKGS